MVRPAGSSGRGRSTTVNRIRLARMDSITLLGLVAGTLTTVSFLPQLVKVWKSQSARDISLWMYLVICTGVLLWLIYGLAVHSVPVIAANAVTLVIAGAILVLKLRLG